MISAAVPIILAVAAGWSTKTEVCVVLMLLGFAIAGLGHAGDSNGVAGLGWLLMIAGFVGIA
jgi:hypothetical protein